MLGEKLAMSSWTIFLFVFWLRIAMKLLSYKTLSKQVMLWSRRAGGKRVLKRFLKCWQTGCEQTQYAYSSISDSWLKQHSNGTYLIQTLEMFHNNHLQFSNTPATLWIDKEWLRLWHTATTNYNWPKSSLQHVFLHLRNVFQGLRIMSISEQNVSLYKHYLRD